MGDREKLPIGFLRDMISLPIVTEVMLYGYVKLIEGIVLFRPIENQPRYLAFSLLKQSRHDAPQSLNTPNFVSGIGAFKLTSNAWISTSRVCAGSMMPSSQSRALA